MFELNWSGLLTPRNHCRTIGLCVAKHLLGMSLPFDSHVSHVHRRSVGKQKGAAGQKPNCAFNLCSINAISSLLPGRFEHDIGRDRGHWYVKLADGVPFGSLCTILPLLGNS